MEEKVQKRRYLENTLLSKLPSRGIESLTTLDIKGTTNLISLPDTTRFKKLSEVSVEYSMHCCAFRAIRDFPKLNNTRSCPDLISVTDQKRQKRSPNFTTTTDFMTEGSLDDFLDDPIDKFFKDIIDSFTNKDSDNETDPCDMRIDLEHEPMDNRIKCSPEPDEFNPCEDVMGTHVLRIFSWIISIFAVIGNIFQLVILFSSRQELTVYKLLMYNLGFSNLLMGIYLLVLCCVDGYTYGKYYNFAQSWQYNGGCKTIGFMALFATQLSVCSLLLITIERFLLIIYALQVQNQMKLKHAMIGISLSWLYSFIVALLPLSDTIGSYTKVAICLPMSMKTGTSQSYVLWLLLSYVVAFLLIVFCYIRMYININDVRPGNSSQTIDIQVAKRMSMIIFSNFLCWLPISLAGIMAMYSNIEFNVGVGKFLLVFIFPLNACTNPFLYAIFTKVFRGDTLALLSSCGLFKIADVEHQRNLDKRGNPQTALQHFVHIRDRVDSFRNSHQEPIETQTEFDCPQSPIKVTVNSDYQNGRVSKIQTLQDIAESYPAKWCNNKRNPEPFEKLRSDSKRGLLESEIKQCRDPRYRSESNDTCSTGISRTSVMETDEEFSKIIGSIQRAEGSMLLE